jgi:four helix bundle protein
MLRIYPVILEWLASLRPVIDAVARCDRHLADQLRRSSTSVALNVAEGMAASGRSKTGCYRLALREMREAAAALEIASMLGYVAQCDSGAADRQGRITGTLVRLAVPWQA